MKKIELAENSCGAGEHRGGMGLDFHYLMLEDSYVTATMERCKTKPWGSNGGREGRPNGGALELSNGERTEITKATGLKVPKGSTFEIRCGGGGGF